MRLGTTSLTPFSPRFRQRITGGIVTSEILRRPSLGKGFTMTADLGSSMHKIGHSRCIAAGVRVNLSGIFSFFTRPTNKAPFSELTSMRLTVLR